MSKSINSVFLQVGFGKTRREFYRELDREVVSVLMDTAEEKKPFLNDNTDNSAASIRKNRTRLSPSLSKPKK